jgi:hypothetical protein
MNTKQNIIKLLLQGYSVSIKRLSIQPIHRKFGPTHIQISCDDWRTSKMKRDGKYIEYGICDKYENVDDAIDEFIKLRNKLYPLDKEE